MKQVIDIISKIIAFVAVILITILHFTWKLAQQLYQLVRQLVLWLMPRVKETSAAAQQRIKQELDDLPTQMERTKETVLKKTEAFRANMPEYNERLNNLTKQVKNAVSDTIQQVQATTAQTLANIQQAQPQPAKVIKQDIDKPSTHTFKKKYLWAALVALVAIGGVMSLSKKSSGSSSGESSVPSASSSSSGIYNSPGVMPTTTSQGNSSDADDSYLNEVLNQMRQEDQERLKSYQEEDRIKNIEAKNKKAESDAMINRMHNQHKAEERQMTTDRIRRMGGY